MGTGTGHAVCMPNAWTLESWPGCSAYYSNSNSSTTHVLTLRPGGGGGGALSPFLVYRYVPQQSENWGLGGGGGGGSGAAQV